MVVMVWGKDCAENGPKGDDGTQRCEMRMKMGYCTWKILLGTMLYDGEGVLSSVKMERGLVWKKIDPSFRQGSHEFPELDPTGKPSRRY